MSTVAPEPLSTQCPSLDALLEGGLERDAVTLVFGEGGSGKTNLALQASRSAAQAGKKVAFIDTEGVSAVRLQQVFGDDALVDHMLFYTPYDIQEQEQMVKRATLPKDLGLVVVDSVNMHYRLHIDGGDDAEKQAARSLLGQLHHLTAFARKHRVPVLVTGQVYGGEDATQPFARRTMEHMVKAIVRFEKAMDPSGSPRPRSEGEGGKAPRSLQDGDRALGLRVATVLKHRSIPEGRRARFRIGPHGLEGSDPALHLRQRSGDTASPESYGVADMQVPSGAPGAEGTTEAEPGRDQAGDANSAESGSDGAEGGTPAHRTTDGVDGPTAAKPVAAGDESPPASGADRTQNGTQESAMDGVGAEAEERSPPSTDADPPEVHTPSPRRQFDNTTKTG